MLVKDAEGDYAVIVGKWEVQRNRTLQRCASKILPVDIVHLRAIVNAGIIVQFCLDNQNENIERRAALVNSQIDEVHSLNRINIYLYLQIVTFLQFYFYLQLLRILASS